LLKTRKKSISLLVTLAFLFTVIIPAGAAFAGSKEYVDISASYTYVDDDTDKAPAGVISVVYGEDYASVSGDIETIYVEITLPEDMGVEFTDVTDSVYGPRVETGADYGVIGTTDTSITYKVYGNFGALDFKVNNIWLDIPADVSGDVDTSVRVWAVDRSNGVLWDVTENVTIAKIKTGNTTVSADSPKIVDIGSGKKGAKITLKELSPGAFTANTDKTATNNDIILTIKNSDVEWDINKMNDTDLDATNGTQRAISTVGLAVYQAEYGISSEDLSNDNRTLHLDVIGGTTVLNGRIEITPYFKVKPGASGDIVVKVSGDDVDTVELTVAKIGEGAVDITVEKADKDTAYLGQKTTLDDVKVTLDPTTELDDDDYITITLPEGVKWVDPADSDPVTLDNNNYTYNSIYNDDRSLWIDVNVDTDKDVELSKFVILVDSDAEIGDLEVTFGGAAQGTYKIATIKAPFTVTAEEKTFPQKGSDVPGGKIVITETADGALKETKGTSAGTYEPKYLDIVLPVGFTWAREPEIDVVEGDLKAKIAGLDEEILRIEITAKSNLPSVIELTDVYFDIDNRAAVGDVIAKVGKEYNVASSGYLATVKLGTIASPTAANAVMKIGDTTIVINGEEKTMDVAPYIVPPGRTMIPVRYAANAVGVSDENILWDQAAKRVTILKGDRVAQFTVGSNVMLINGASVVMDVTPEIVAPGRVMLPIRWVARALGLSDQQIQWDEDTQTVTINVE